MNKRRAPRPVRRMGTEVIKDRRTRRRRTRADDERAALEEQEARYFLASAGWFAEKDDQEKSR